MRRCKVALATQVLLALACWLGVPGAASADGTELGLEVPILTGEHVTGDATSYGTIALPIIHLRQTAGPLEAAIEFLPRVTSPESVQHPADSLSALTATLRVFEPSKRLGLGIGEIVYNARADFAGGDPHQQFSRVVGGRYEMVMRTPVRHDRRFEVEAGLAPSLHGNVFTQVVATIPGNSFYVNYIDAERADQFDCVARYSIERGNGSFQVGLRYINYRAAYASSGRISDVNVGFGPTVSYNLRLR